ncbi:hypothetical protein, partial [Heyndrickxia coagulans]|uniref:hypothetical protein n=1 Tax=Heyndrickxia coagulans TaxID=1398 RepID=UPI00214DAAF4
SKAQNTFVAKRQIPYASLIVNKVVDDKIKEKNKRELSKSDLEKTYDQSSWKFLEKVLSRPGFGQRLRN